MDRGRRPPGAAGQGHIVAQTWAVGITFSDVHDVSYGNLIVSLVNAEANTLVWRAIAKSGVKGDIKKLERKIDKITKKMFSQYPE